MTKQYRVELIVGNAKINMKVWAENPKDAEEKVTAENNIDNYELKSVREI